VTDGERFSESCYRRSRLGGDIVDGTERGMVRPSDYR
jgi:hypothetical protein